MDKWLYLFIELSAISVPLVASFDRRLRFDRQWRYLFPAILLTMIVFIPWDMLKTALGVWGFNPRYLIGYYFGNLPVEEWIFFITIPYACLFTYHALNWLFQKDYFGQIAPAFTLMLAITLLFIGFMNFARLYTSVTFISTGSFLLFHRFVLRKNYLGRFFMMYFITIIPFFIVNGLLTGSFIPGEVVYYDDTQNLGIRLGTIPVEDLVYGMMMLLMNVTWFEWLKSRKSLNAVSSRTSS
jgi:lycopene cyclase domain-containing protein